MNQKNLTNIILVAVIVILLGAVGYFALVKKPPKIAQQTNTPAPIQTQTPKNETADWQTYKNDKYGFSFQYPQSWTVNDQSYSYNGQNYLSATLASPLIHGVPGAIRDAYFYITIFNDGRAWTHKEGINLSLQHSDGGAVPVNVGAQYLKSMAEYKISQAIANTITNYHPITFTQQNETSSWKIFNDAVYGYSFKYPSNYVVKEYGTEVQVYESSDTNTQSLVDFYGQKTDIALSAIIKDKTDGRVLSNAIPTTVNGLSAYEGIDQGIVSSYGVFVKDNSNFVEIRFGSTDRNDLQESKSALTSTQKLILSTFKFTN